MDSALRERLHFLLLNVGHFLDHLFMLIFATVAALTLTREWGLGYADLLTYATPGFFAFGVFALPAGWLADKWSREGMTASVPRDLTPSTNSLSLRGFAPTFRANGGADREAGWACVRETSSALPLRQ